MSESTLNIKNLFPVSIDCTSGQASIKIKYNTIKWPNGQLQKEYQDQNLSDPKLICYLSSLRHGETKEQIQSAGDMIIENNLLFNQQNHFNEGDNSIMPWSVQDPLSCYKLQYNGDTPLQQFKLQYKNLYL